MAPGHVECRGERLQITETRITMLNSGWTRLASQLFTAAVALNVLPSVARSQPDLPKHITPATVEAIDKGLKYLDRTQGRDGAWPNTPVWVAGSCPCCPVS